MRDTSRRLETRITYRSDFHRRDFSEIREDPRDLTRDDRSERGRHVASCVFMKIKWHRAPHRWWIEKEAVTSETPRVSHWHRVSA